MAAQLLSVGLYLTGVVTRPEWLGDLLAEYVLTSSECLLPDTWALDWVS